MSDNLHDELLGSISSDPNTSVRLAKVFIKNKKIIPEIVLQGIVSDEKMGGHLSRNVACDYLDRDMEVPEILLNKIIEEPLNAYYMGKSYHDHGIRVPDIILKALGNTKLGINLRSYITENIILENNDLQNELLPKILDNPHYTLRYAKVLVQNNKPVPDFVENAFSNSPEAASNYAKIIANNGGKVSEKIIDIIKTDPDASFAFAEGTIINDYVVPLEIVKSLAKNCKYASNYGTMLLEKGIINQKIFKILENAIVKAKVDEHVYGPATKDQVKKAKEQERQKYAGRYASVYAKILGDLPDKKVTDLVTPQNMVLVANNILAHNKPLPENVIDIIASSPSASTTFLARYHMRSNDKKFPPSFEKIVKSMEKYESEHI